MSNSQTIIYTWTDEAPALATHAFLPVARAFAGAAGVELKTRDISLAHRVLAQFPGELGERRVSDDLAELGEKVERPEANVIKLPNISASVPQLKACIAELKQGGFNLPDYPEAPASAEEREIKARFDVALGSAVNPVLRQGNSDRRAPDSVKEYARNNPGRMRDWPADSKTHVATMSSGDFFHNEKSVTVTDPTSVRIEHVATDGTVSVLKTEFPLLAGEVLDATCMSARALSDFLREQVADARERGVLFSLHLKATMMKVSDPVIFGHGVRAYFHDLFEKHGETLARLGADPDYGFGDIEARIATLPDSQRAEIEADIRSIYESGPGVAMVNSGRGITNLHVPSDVIIDASMPPMIRDSGRMWNAAGNLEDCKAVIPDSSYAGIYDAIVQDVKKHGQFKPAEMGSVPNVGLMAQAAEEYGSHNKTFKAPSDGTIRVVNSGGQTLLEHSVEQGDIWRACQTKDLPIRNWVGLGVRRAKATGDPAVFWLDRERAHDAELIAKVETYLAEFETDDLDIRIMAPFDAMQFSLERIRRGEDTISVTGNVLRDYLTDLFPILELGTSARVLSIVPLLAGGGLFETGAGGSAPLHVQQFQAEGHLRWDSLGEYMALAASFQHLADQSGNGGAAVLARALDSATAGYLNSGRLPLREVHQLDNRGSMFYLAMYWARAMADQDDDPALGARFRPVASALEENEAQILSELEAAQGAPQDLGGYYLTDPDAAGRAMRPSETFNRIIESL